MTKLSVAIATCFMAAAFLVEADEHFPEAKNFDVVIKNDSSYTYIYTGQESASAIVLDKDLKMKVVDNPDVPEDWSSHSLHHTDFTASKVLKLAADDDKVADLNCAGIKVNDTINSFILLDPNALASFSSVSDGAPDKDQQTNMLCLGEADAIEHSTMSSYVVADEKIYGVEEKKFIPISDELTGESVPILVSDAELYGFGNEFVAIGSKTVSFPITVDAKGKHPTLSFSQENVLLAKQKDIGEDCVLIMDTGFVVSYKAQVKLPEAEAAFETTLIAVVDKTVKQILIKGSPSGGSGFVTMGEISEDERKTFICKSSPITNVGSYEIVSVSEGKYVGLALNGGSKAALLGAAILGVFLAMF